MTALKKYFSFELLFWLTALIYLGLSDPSHPHFSFCVFQHLGFSYCPGCGIGRSISYLLHGDLHHSFQSHWLGTFALAVIASRIYQLINNIHTTLNQSNYGKSIHNT